MYNDFFRQYAIASFIDYSIVKSITSISMGKPKYHVTHFVAILALLQWSGTELAISQRFACIS